MHDLIIAATFVALLLTPCIVAMRNANLPDEA